MQTDTESYRDGYKKGQVWNNNWMPGGPWYMRCSTVCPRCARDKNRLRVCKQLEQRHHDWMRGFNDGLAEKKTLDILSGS